MATTELFWVLTIVRGHMGPLSSDKQVNEHSNPDLQDKGGSSLTMTAPEWNVKSRKYVKISLLILLHLEWPNLHWVLAIMSAIGLRQPKLKTNPILRTLSAKSNFFYFMIYPEYPLIKCQLWHCSKAVLKITLEKSQRWS